VPGPQPRRVLIVGPSPERPGGIAAVLRYLVDALPTRAGAASYDVHRFATDKPTGPGDPLPARALHGLRLAVRLCRRVDEFRPDLVHLHSSGGWGLREANVLLNVVRTVARNSRVLLQLHATSLPAWLAERPVERSVILRALRVADAVAAVSSTHAAELRELGVPADRLLLIRNGVPLLPPGDAPRPAPSPGAPLHLVVVGSIEDRKGISVLLDAVRLLHESGPEPDQPPLRIDAIGPAAVPPARLESWRREGAALGIEFPGPLAPESLAVRLRACDGLVLPSLAEALPMAVLEAMAAGVPVLASSVGALPELLSDGAGDLVPPGDPRALATALRRWIDEPARRLALGPKGRARVAEGWSAAAMADAALRAWDSLCR
jgi:glycosyltransferase involved in cell wall biosynthesis